jgi:hypothetical protein
MKLKEYARLLGLMVSLVLAHQVRPELTDVFIVLCIIIAVWQVLDWKFMSRERRRIGCQIQSAAWHTPRPPPQSRCVS